MSYTNNNTTNKKTNKQENKQTSKQASKDQQKTLICKVFKLKSNLILLPDN